MKATIFGINFDVTLPSCQSNSIFIHNRKLYLFFILFRNILPFRSFQILFPYSKRTDSPLGSLDPFFSVPMFFLCIQLTKMFCLSSFYFAFCHCHINEKSHSYKHRHLSKSPDCMPFKLIIPVYPSVDSFYSGPLFI